MSAQNVFLFRNGSTHKINKQKEQPEKKSEVGLVNRFPCNPGLIQTGHRQSQDKMDLSEPYG